jgi:two-component system OmpR family sensor kinase
MSTVDAGQHSLRTRLLWLLLAAIVLTAIAQALIAYRGARAEADAIFDYHMQQMALSLRSGLPAVAWSGGDLGPRDEADLNFVVQVWTADGLRIFQSAARSTLPQRTVQGFSDVNVNGSIYRVYSLQTRSQVIQVAQDMTARSAMAGTLALRTLLPIAAMAPLLMLLVWWAVNRSMAPVARVRRQVAERQADDLGEVSEVGLPDEIAPLVREFNLLFGRVRQAFEAQRNFVADAAHELRTPLAALKLQVQGLQRAPDSAARDLALTRLSAGIDRASRLVEQLLLLARHQAGKATGAQLETVQLADVARLAVADAAQAAQARGIDAGLSCVDAGDVAANSEALRILMRNLLDNAIKYSPPGGKVDVEVKRLGPGMRLTVEDSGPGIEEADRERVLDRFHRVASVSTDASTDAGTDAGTGATTGATGSGLGLAIVKSIADMHGASLRLSKSRRLGGLRVELDFGQTSADQAISRSADRPVGQISPSTPRARSAGTGPAPARGPSPSQRRKQAPP